MCRSILRCTKTVNVTPTAQEYADEKCMEIIARSLSLAFLICDDNIGGVPTAFPPRSSWSQVFSPAAAPRHLVTMRLGREHYRGALFCMDGREHFDFILAAHDVKYHALSESAEENISQLRYPIQILSLQRDRVRRQHAAPRRRRHARTNQALLEGVHSRLCFGVRQ